VRLILYVNELSARICFTYREWKGDSETWGRGERVAEHEGLIELKWRHCLKPKVLIGKATLPHGNLQAALLSQRPRISASPCPSVPASPSRRVTASTTFPIGQTRTAWASSRDASAGTLCRDENGRP
jgi:hypothetical protein